MDQRNQCKEKENRFRRGAKLLSYKKITILAPKKIYINRNIEVTLTIAKKGIWIPNVIFKTHRGINTKITNKDENKTSHEKREISTCLSCSLYSERRLTEKLRRWCVDGGNRQQLGEGRSDLSTAARRWVKNETKESGQSRIADTICFLKKYDN